MKNTRWQQRFENFEKAFILLSNTFNNKKLEQFSDLEKEGIIQRFECTFEFAWKTLKDYLEYSGIVLEQISPRQVIKQAFSAKIITDGKMWIDMLEHRNMMSHTYNKKRFDAAVDAIANQYISVIQQVFLVLKQKDSEL